ncbi:formate dehydrogenase subunit delta [Pseudonocardia sichuanensis]
MDTATVPPHVRMINEIAVQFAHHPTEEAAAAIAAHLRAFWEPRMTAALQAHVDAGGAGLSPAAARAAELLRARS